MRQLSRHRKISYDSGFTLIELLGVIAIISILAAILFPVFAKVREKARQTSCASNEKQLGLAFQQYSSDNDDIMPTYGDGGSASTEGAGWGGQVYAYVKSASLYKCPDDPTVGSGNLVPISYAYNAVIGGTLANSGHIVGAVPKMVAPSKTVLLCECSNIKADITSQITDVAPLISGANVSPSATGGANSASDFYVDVPIPHVGLMETGNMGNRSFTSRTGRHTDGSNFLFCDGHVKWLRGSQVSTGNDAGNGCGGDSNSAQDADYVLPSACTNAAGTNVSTWAATFSAT